MPDPRIISTPITRIIDGIATDTDDAVAVEEPLEIWIGYWEGTTKKQKSISVTMRTPGHDHFLATGFLYTEGIVTRAGDVVSVGFEKDNVIIVQLADHLQPDVARLERNFYTTSSCGVCGKTSIDAVVTACPLPEAYPYDGLKIPVATIYTLPDTMRQKQSLFEQTGGIHACGLFNNSGELLFYHEDIGRHNAMDKLVGESLTKLPFPLDAHVLLLSGRASFELMQKAAMAGLKIVVAVGAPSSLAVQMAEEWNMTLVGFLRGVRCNVYAGAQRIVI